MTPFSQRTYTIFRPLKLIGHLSAFALIFLLARGQCGNKIYEHPCGAPCKYGDHLIYLQTSGIRDPERLEKILDSLGLQRGGEFMVEPRYLVAGDLGIKWLGEYKKEMTLSEYNRRLNAELELFAPENRYFYREVLYSDQRLDGDRQILFKLRKALHMNLGNKDDAIGYVGDLCSAYDHGCEKAFPSIIPIHKFGVEAENRARTEWNIDSAYEHFPFLEEQDVSFYGQPQHGEARFYTDREDGTVTFGLDLRGLSCIEIQNLAINLGIHSRIEAIKGGSVLEMATPIGCEEQEVKRRKKPDL